MDNLGELETLDKLLKSDFKKLFGEIKQTSGELNLDGKKLWMNWEEVEKQEKWHKEVEATIKRNW